MNEIVAIDIPISHLSKEILASASNDNKLYEFITIIDESIDANIIIPLMRSSRIVVIENPIETPNINDIIDDIYNIGIIDSDTLFTRVPDSIGDTNNPTIAPIVIGAKNINE
jgi:hypothetical protein